MKTTIIILAVIGVICLLIAQGCENYIKSDKSESFRYVMYRGATKLGIIYSLSKIIGTILICADAILILSFFLNAIN